MAEGLFRTLVGDSTDYHLESAGISAATGQKASQHTVDVLKSEKVDLSRFRSQPLTKAMVDEATHIFAMTQGHREYVESERMYQRWRVCLWISKRSGKMNGTFSLAGIGV